MSNANAVDALMCCCADAMMHCRIVLLLIWMCMLGSMVASLEPDEALFFNKTKFNLRKDDYAKAIRDHNQSLRELVPDWTLPDESAEDVVIEATPVKLRRHIEEDVQTY